MRIDVAGIRKKLVEGKYDIVNVTEMTGLSSVLAGGKAKIRMAEPLANKFMEAKNILADMGIEIQVADSLVDYGVKKKQYEKYISGGEKGAQVADPDRSFHTIGFAFDLAQSQEMKRPEVAEALKSVGLIPHDDEWWHWSLEKV
jgi:D-alanyl-D-alanine dipeptidase